MDVATELIGVTRIADSLGDAGPALADLRDVNADAGALVLDAAVIPRLSGALASTAHVEASAFGASVVAGGPVAPYAPTVHARTPFLTDALTARVDAITDRYLDHAERVVETIRGA